MITALESGTPDDGCKTRKRSHVTVDVRFEAEWTPVSFGMLRWFVGYMNKRLRRVDAGSMLAIPDKNGIWGQVETTGGEGWQRLFASLKEELARGDEHLRYRFVRPAPRWGDAKRRLARRYATFQVNLTRKVFFALRPGTFISGKFSPGWLQPDFELAVKSRARRQQQWLLVCRAKADRRNCVVYLSTESRNAWSGLPKWSP